MTEPLDPEAVTALRTVVRVYHQYLEETGKRIVDNDCVVLKPVKAGELDRNGRCYMQDAYGDLVSVSSAIPQSGETVYVEVPTGEKP